MFCLKKPCDLLQKILCFAAKNPVFCQKTPMFFHNNSVLWHIQPFVLSQNPMFCHNNSVLWHIQPFVLSQETQCFVCHKNSFFSHKKSLCFDTKNPVFCHIHIYDRLIIHLKNCHFYINYEMSLNLFSRKRVAYKINRFCMRLRYLLVHICRGKTSVDDPFLYY